jgi:hypothetical protein
MLNFDIVLIHVDKINYNSYLFHIGNTNRYCCIIERGDHHMERYFKQYSCSKYFYMVPGDTLCTHY